MVSEEQNKALMEDITFEEFTRAVKQKHPDKAAGLDGLNPAFFRIFGRVWVWRCTIVARSG